MVEARRPSAIKAKPARRKPRPKLKAEGQGWNPLLDYFSSTHDSSPKGVLEQLKNLREDDRDILWYPSSGIDLTDITNIDNVNVKGTPRIFIHTDPLDYPDPANVRENEVLRFQNEREAVLFKIQIDGEYKWLFHIKINNYDFLPWLLKSGVSITFLYTACDGVTSGMGGSLHNFPISTFYLTRFYKILGVKYHITEYSCSYYEEDPLRIMENLQSEVPRLIESYPELGRVKAPEVPESFINLKESSIKSFLSEQRNQLVVRYCNT